MVPRISHVKKCQTYDNPICSSLSQNLCSPDIAPLQILNLSLGQRTWLPVCLIQTRQQLLARRGLWVRIQKLGYLPTGELQLREEQCASGFCCLHSRTEGFHGVPGVVDVENSIVVVLKVVTVDRDVASANEASATVSKLCVVLVKVLVRFL